MRLNTVAITTLTGAIHGSVFVWFVGMPLAVAQREQFILRQVQPCTQQENVATNIQLPTLGVSIYVTCENNRDLGELKH